MADTTKDTVTAELDELRKRYEALDTPEAHDVRSLLAAFDSLTKNYVRGIERRDIALGELVLKVHDLEKACAVFTRYRDEWRGILRLAEGESMRDRLVQLMDDRDVAKADA